MPAAEPGRLSADHNLLFGILALQMDFISRDALIAAMHAWVLDKTKPLGQVFVEQRVLRPDQRAALDVLVGMHVECHQGSPEKSLAAVGDEVKRSLAALADPDLERSLAGLHGTNGTVLEATVDFAPGPHRRYSLTRLHATGGIGRVWLARDADLGRDVALKELRPERADDASLWFRFLKEAKITGQLAHPGVVPVYELSHRPEDQQPFYTMQFVKGRTLTEAARSYHQKRVAGQADSLEFLTLLNAFVAVCNTVAYAHSRGVIHRDLKGQNVVLGDFGEVIVLDWGLAKLVDCHDPEAATPPITLDSDHAASPDLTAEGQTVGTPAYMAPEQAAGRLDLIDRRTDVYGLGAMLYELLTGEPPFRGANTLEVLRKVREEEPTPPRTSWPNLPPALEAICLRALAKKPSDRPAGPGELAQEVQGWQEKERRKAEDALRESEALYHSLVESLPCSVFRKDLEGRFTFANQRFCEHLGLPLDQLLGRTDFDICPRDLAEKYRRDDQQVIATGKVFEDVEEHQLLGGKGKCYVHTLKAAVRDAGGKIVGTQVIFWDVTERKIAEEELRKSRERLELVVQGSQDGLWDWDLTTDEVYYSPRYKAMVGYEDQEFPNRREEWEKRVHPDDLARVKSELGAHFKSRESLSWVEFRFRHKDGSYRWIRSRAFVLRDANGRVYRMAGSHEDITDKKNADEALRQQTELLQSILDCMNECVCVADKNGKFLLFNRTAERLVGVGSINTPPLEWAERYGCFLLDRVTPWPAAELPLVRAIRGEEVVDAQVYIRTAWMPEGAYVSANARPLKAADGSLQGGVVTFRDITQQTLALGALRESEERYRSVIAAMQDGIALLDTDGRIIACNASAERILGLSADQIMSRTPNDPRWQSIHEDGSPFPGETHPPMVTLRTGQPCRDVVMGVHKPDGTLTWISINSQPLYKADGTTLSGVVASFEDITERRKTEEALRQATAELARLQISEEPP